MLLGMLRNRNLHTLLMRMANGAAPFKNILEVLQFKYTGTALRLPWWPSGEECACQCRGLGFDPRLGN